MDDVLELQNTPDIILNKLELFSEEDDEIHEWSPGQIVQDRIRIIKEVDKTFR